MRLEAVKAALAEEAGVVGITVSDVRGFGHQGELLGFSSSLGGFDPQDTLAPKILIEMIVTDDRVDEIIELVCTYARTGQPGDGKIFVSDMGDAIRVRTGDRGDVAL